MKTIAALLIGAMIALPLRAKKLEITKKAGDLAVHAAFDRDPPSVGVNGLEIRLKDAAGAAVAADKVVVQYYMPPMPRMAPMNDKVEAKMKKDAYLAKLKLIMAGPWIVIIRITRGDATVSVRFQIDAR